MKKKNHDDLVENDAVAQHYCDWATKLAHDWRGTQNFCPAHSYLVKFTNSEFETALLKAIAKARPKLKNT
ncbi:MAG: hypothetical protein WA114_05910 [Psychrobacter glacincola]